MYLIIIEIIIEIIKCYVMKNLGNAFTSDEYAYNNQLIVLIAVL